MLTSGRGRCSRPDLQKQDLNGKFCSFQQFFHSSQFFPENRIQRFAKECREPTFQARYNRELFSIQRQPRRQPRIFPKTIRSHPKKFYIQKHQDLAYLSTKIPFTNISSSYYFSRIKFFTRAALALRQPQTLKSCDIPFHFLSSLLEPGAHLWKKKIVR